MFKNATLYRIAPQWSTPVEDVEEQLAKQRFVPCGATVPQSMYEAALIDGCSKFAYLWRPPGWSHDNSRETSETIKAKWEARHRARDLVPPPPIS